MRRRFGVHAIGLSLCVLAPSLHAETTNLASVADTFLVATSPDNNAGGHTHVASGTSGSGSSRRGLYLFDLSGIPAGSVVNAATLSIPVTGTPAVGDVNAVFEVLAVSGAWLEGAGAGSAGAPATAGEVTWNSRVHGSAAWTTAGGDVVPGAVVTNFVDGSGPFTGSSSSLVALVQSWLATPSSNHGILLRCQLEGTFRTAKRFGSREDGTPATLAIDFTPPPPPAITSLRIESNNLFLTWSNKPARKYDVLYTDRLTGTQSWKVAEANIPTTNAWFDPPFLASPMFSANTSLVYALNELPASPPAITVRLDVVAAGFTSPVVVTHCGDGSDRLFVAEQRGLIRVLDSNRVVNPVPFLDIINNVTNLNPGYDERGLLGLTFHPGYATNGKFYVYYSARKVAPGVNHESRVSEFLVSTTNANTADPASERIVMQFDQPEGNHNGGTMEFGTDGYLYIATGDGGGAGDNHPPFGNGQNISNLLGKILRIDVDSALPYAIPPDNPLVGVPGARGEIYAWGFRNPWRFAFDGTNLWVADVGQNLWEEINLVRKGGNYGWKIMESHHTFDLTVATTLGIDVRTLDYPIHEYKHGPLGISIIGGAVYRGTNVPGLVGSYVFGDFSTSFGVPDGALYYIDETRAGLWERFMVYLAPTNGRLNRYVKGFGTDESGDLYLLSTTVLGPTGTSGDIRLFSAP